MRLTLQLPIRIRAIARPVMVGLFSFMVSTGVLANPVLDNVAAGQVTIEQTPTTTTINQTSQQAIVNWQSFNIAAPETTHFQQPAGGVALNRINPTQGASQIYGRLTATGRIILVNPAGFYFGPGSFVNVGGIIASTADISNEDFLNNYYHFSNSSTFNGAIVTKGQIIAADNGLVALIGGAVSNDGMIQANMGYIVLASGTAFTMTFAGNDLIGFAVDSGITKRGVDHNGNAMSDGVSHSGALYADGGSILITAKAAAGVLDNVINMRGIAQTKSIYKKNGRIILSSDPKAGKVSVSGKLIASGKNKGEKGGNIDITGYNILLASPSLLDVSGDIGGGNINIGGNYQGKGPLPNANAVAMESGAQILADAISSGNGGNVVLWSDYFTSARGNISAHGGAISGNGGFIETSGKQFLDVNNIEINVGAQAGLAGQWLLDPANLTIGNTNTAVTGTSPFQPTGGSGSFLNVATLTSALLSGNVTVQTLSGIGSGDGDIIIDSAIAYTSVFSLTLSAFRHISSTLSNAVINNSGSGTVTLRADNSGTGVGTVSLTGIITPTITASGGVNIYYNPALGSFGTNTALYSGGTTPTQYMLIQSLGTSADLATTNSLGALSNPANTSLWSQNFALAKNIDASATSAWNSGAGFSPIGNNSTNFTGKFDGQNFTISNLFATQPANQYIGMFGKTSSAARLSNLVLSNPTISGRSYVGSLVGWNVGNVTNITVNGGTVTGATSGSQRWDVGGIIGYHVTGSISNLTVNNMAINGYSYLGGIIGQIDSANGIINNLSINNSTVTATRFEIGGIAGYTNGVSYTNIFNSNTSVRGNSDVGGLFGYMGSGSLNTAYNTGTIGAMADSPSSVGGLIGSYGTSTPYTIQNVYNTGDIFGYDTVAGIAGYYSANINNKSTITNAYNTGTMTYTAYYGAGIVGLAYGVILDKVYNTGTIQNSGTQNVPTSESGGIVGQLVGGIVRNSYNTGAVILTNGTTGGYLGGIIGYNYHFTFNPINYVNIVENVYNTGYISNGNQNGAIVGVVNTGSTSYYIFNGNNYWNSETSGVTKGVGSLGSDPATVISKTSSQMKQEATYSGWNFGTTWNILENTSYPFLRTFYPDASTTRVISGTSGVAGGNIIGLAYNGSEFDNSMTGNNGAFYFLTGNNALSGQTGIPNGASVMLYFANSSNDANSVIVAPSAYGSITNASLAVNTMTISGGAVSNSTLSTLISGLSASNLLFSLTGNNLTLGTASAPTVNLTTDFSTTYTLNGNITNYDTINGGDVTFNGPVTVSTDAVINLGTGDVTMAANVDGAQALEITTSGNIVISGVIGDTAAPTSLEVKGGGNTTISSARITTAGAQIYRNPTTFGANTVMTVGSGAYLGFTGNASGASHTLTLAGSGNNTFTMNGGNYNFAAINVNGSGTGNTLYANTGASQTWDISGANAGSIAALNLAFSGIQSLTGNSSNNTFIFADGGSLSGTIDGITATKTNTMNFTNYTTPIRIALNTTYSGQITNNNGAAIANFLNMTNTINNTAANNSSIALPTGKSGSVNVTGKMIGYINDPFYFNNFQTVTGAPGQTNTLAFNTTAVITSNTGNIITAIINGITMTFENFTMSGNTSATPTTSDVAGIINEPITDAEDNNNYGAENFYSANGTDMSVLNQTYTTPLDKTSTVRPGATCYGTN